jgi:hypothetical protein
MRTAPTLKRREFLRNCSSAHAIKQQRDDNYLLKREALACESVSATNWCIHVHNQFR